MTLSNKFQHYFIMDIQKLNAFADSYFLAVTFYRSKFSMNQLFFPFFYAYISRWNISELMRGRNFC